MVVERKFFRTFSYIGKYTEFSYELARLGHDSRMFIARF